MWAWFEENPGWLFAVFIVVSILMTITEILLTIYRFRYM